MKAMTYIVRNRQTQEIVDVDIIGRSSARAAKRAREQYTDSWKPLFEIVDERGKVIR